MSESEVKLVDITTTGTKEATELGNAIKKLMVDAHEAKKNDGKIGTDELGAIAMANFKSISDAIGGLQNIGSEAKEKPLALSRGILNPVTEGIEAILE